VRTLTNSEYCLMEKLIGFSQHQLSDFLYSFLKSKYSNVTKTKDYIYAIGDIPVALLAHMDTVFKAPATELYYDTRKNLMWSPTGAGFDDRAGVFSIIQIIKAGFKPHIIFTTDEEVGGLGSQALSHIACPFKELSYMIQLDRRGTNDCVFYDCDNEDFVKYIEHFGFTEAWGSFTDICWLCPAWGVAGVNLSIGYRDEHTSSEVLFVGPMLSTIKKTIKILSQKEFPKFEYIPFVWHSNGLYGKYYDDYFDPYSKYYDGYGAYQDDYYEKWYSDVDDCCDCCGKPVGRDDLLEVERKDGSVGFYCLDCIEKHAEFCVRCGNAFEIDENNVHENMCYRCRRELDREEKHDRVRKYPKAI